MGAVRPQNEQELEQQVVTGPAVGVPGEPVLPANLAELAGPVGNHRRKAAVRQQSVLRPVGPVVSPPNGPASRKPVVGRRIESKRWLNRKLRLTPAPDQLGPGKEIVIDGSP